MGRDALAERVTRLRSWGYAARVAGRQEVARLEAAPTLPDDVPGARRRPRPRPGPAQGPYVLVTHSGVTLAAVLAELAARELLEDVRLPELAPFRPLRFA